MTGRVLGAPVDFYKRLKKDSGFRQWVSLRTNPDTEDADMLFSLTLTLDLAETDYCTMRERLEFAKHLRDEFKSCGDGDDPDGYLRRALETAIERLTH